MDEFHDYFWAYLLPLLSLSLIKINSLSKAVVVGRGRKDETIDRNWVRKKMQVGLRGEHKRHYSASQCTVDL